MSTIKTGIIEFGRHLISRKSFSSFSYDDIAHEFNMTKAAVHYHFRNKEDLGIAICESLCEKLYDMRRVELAAIKKGRHRSGTGSGGKTVGCSSRHGAITWNRASIADFHSLRHSFITSLAKAGVHPKVAQDLARHSSIELTMGHYTHTCLDSRLDAIGRLPDFSAINSESAKKTGTDDVAVGKDGKMMDRPADSIATDLTDF